MEWQKRKCFGKVILSFTALSLAFTLNACGGKSDREDKALSVQQEEWMVYLLLMFPCWRRSDRFPAWRNSF